MLIIYDSTGKIFMAGSGHGTPSGSISYLDGITIPEGKYLKGVDTSVEPHQPIFEECPPTEMELLQESNEQQQADIDYLLLLLEV